MGFAFVSGPAMTAGFVCLIASLAYLTMATGNGTYTRCCDGRLFFFARYIDWVLTTPIMIHGLVHFAGAPDDTFVYLFFMDIPMIAYICWWKNEVVDAQFDYGFYFWNYGSMANLTTIAWFLYPVVWIMSEGLTVLSADGEAIVYTVLDL